GCNDKGIDIVAEYLGVPLRIQYKNREIDIGRSTVDELSGAPGSFSHYTVGIIVVPYKYREGGMLKFTRGAMDA
ncbi:8778_t:CDS:2, partial [Dentiscutata erythropus]